MELQHFVHEHPLILDNEKNDDGEKIVCQGCQQVISGSAYSCRNCYFFLHKLCAELPAEMKHPMHQEHPLTLQSLPDYVYDYCALCNENLHGFHYRCSPCCFGVDIRCAVRSQSVEHESHRHPLSPVLSSASFKCYACRTTREGISYMCNTCTFWIHEDCASLPTTIKHNNHVHPLTLAYSFPFKDFLFDRLHCGICEEKLNRNWWFYYCRGCYYIIHVNCSTRTRGSESTIKSEELDVANSIHLPVPSDSVSLIDQFVKQISLEDSNAEADQLNHFSHEHPLTLFNGHNNDDNLNEQKIEKICDACVGLISVPFYSCSLCSNFFLHKWCAKLPNEVQHPCHPHPLSLRGKLPFLGFFECNGCANVCNGFAFRCVEDGCVEDESYNLDVKCSSLPRSIVHEAHEHPLLIRQHCIKEGCVACGRYKRMFSYGCGTCDFNLHYKCALLPCTVTLRNEQHPLSLTYSSSVKDGSDEYYCELCKRRIDTKWWFYHSASCDLSVCARCIYKEEKKDPNIKWRTTKKFNTHPHPLTLVQPTSKSPLCGDCHRSFTGYEMGYECEQCNIMFHPGCAMGKPSSWIQEFLTEGRAESSSK